jgi:hypothetical protein
MNILDDATGVLESWTTPAGAEIEHEVLQLFVEKKAEQNGGTLNPGEMCKALEDFITEIRSLSFHTRCKAFESITLGKQQ